MGNLFINLFINMYLFIFINKIKYIVSGIILK